MDYKRSELKLECLKIAVGHCREHPEAMLRAKEYEQYVLAQEKDQEIEIKTFSQKDKRQSK